MDAEGLREGVMKPEKFVVRGVTRKEKKEMEAVFRFVRNHLNEVEAAIAHQEQQKKYREDLCPGGCGVKKNIL